MKRITFSMFFLVLEVCLWTSKQPFSLIMEKVEVLADWERENKIRGSKKFSAVRVLELRMTMSLLFLPSSFLSFSMDLN